MIQLAVQNVSHVVAGLPLAVDTIQSGPMTLVSTERGQDPVMGHFINSEGIDAVLPSLQSWLNGDAAELSEAVDKHLGRNFHRPKLRLTELPTDLETGAVFFTGEVKPSMGVFFTGEDIGRYQNALRELGQEDRALIHGLVNVFHRFFEAATWQLGDLSALGIESAQDRDLARLMIDILFERLQISAPALVMRLDDLERVWSGLDSLGMLTWTLAVEEQCDLQIRDDLFGDLKQDQFKREHFKILFAYVKDLIAG